MYKIVTTPVFKLCLNRLLHFLKSKYSAQLATDTKEQIKKAIIQKLSENPFVAPISERLIDLGITEYRQVMVDEQNIVFYRIDEDQKEVTLLAVMDSRQSIQKLLSEVVLLV
ncbi:MAG: hypothetical protein COA86_03960 [Kangiella sp.]|nr:MAG: hypothetical protein COA86_04850 [Kangiella sp.]PHS19913.1 MAG: hypothetical protein COA86_03960 [Kangiella sp.]